MSSVAYFSGAGSGTVEVMNGVIIIVSNLIHPILLCAKVTFTLPGIADDTTYNEKQEQS